MIVEGPLPTTMAHRSCSSWALTSCFVSNGLPSPSSLLAFARVRQTLKNVLGVLHLRISELDGDAVLRRSFCDHPFPLYGASTRDVRSIFLDGHLQSEEDGGFILVEHGDDAPTFDDENLPVERVRNIPRRAGLLSSSTDAFAIRRAC